MGQHCVNTDSNAHFIKGIDGKGRQCELIISVAGHLVKIEVLKEDNQDISLSKITSHAYDKFTLPTLTINSPNKVGIAINVDVPLPFNDYLCVLATVVSRIQ